MREQREQLELESYLINKISLDLTQDIRGLEIADL